MRNRATLILVLFLIVVFATGGGSRGDIASLPILRFLAVCGVAVAIVLVRPDDLAKIGVPLVLLAAIGAIALLQLAPLPPELWRRLPDHDLIARIDDLVELELWRPVSLSPAATANSLGSLFVPLAAVLLFSLARNTQHVLLAFLLIGVVGGMLGIVQLFADPRSSIFFYEVTNNGSAVGLFANRNHHAVFLACCVLISLHLAQEHTGQWGRWGPWAFTGCALFLSLAVVTNASRAGLLALLLAAFFGALGAFLSRGPAVHRSVRKAASVGFFAIVGLVIFVLFAAAGRSPALARILQNDALEDLRTKLLPLTLEMVGAVQPWGIGFGSFEYAYRMREPLELLGPAYVNEAHNDWLQFPIEGGLGAIIVMAAGTVYGFCRTGQLFVRGRSDQAAPAIPLLGVQILLILGLASLVDYPLRVPSLQVLAIIALAMFAGPALGMAKDHPAKLAFP